MTFAKKIALNTAIQFIGRFFSILFGVLAIGIMTRTLGVEGYGMYTKVLTFFQITSVLLDFGLSNVTLKYVSHEDDQKSEEILNKILTLRFFLNLLILITPFFSLLLHYETNVVIGIFIFSFSYLVSNFSQVWSILLQKKLNTVPIILGELAARITFLISIFILYKLNLGLIPMVAASAITGLFSTVVVYFGVRKYIHPRFIIDIKLWKEVLKSSTPFAMSVIFNLIYFRADSFILTIFKGNADVGIYGAAYKILDIYVGIPALFMSLLLPTFDRAFKENDKVRFKSLLQKAFDFLLMMAIPIMMGGCLLSNDIVVLLAGKDFIQAGSVLAILCVVMGIITIGAIFTNTVIAVNNQKKMMCGYGIAAFASVVLYLALIPIYSYKVIPYIKIFIEGFIAVLAFVLTYEKIKELPSLKNVVKNIIASIMMCLGIYLLQKFLHAGIFITLPSAVLIYFVVLFLIGGIDKEMIKKVIKKEN